METRVDDEAEMAEAKASLMARMDELGKRFQRAKHALDLEAHITDHPLVAAGVALAAGLLIGSHGTRRLLVVKSGDAETHVSAEQHAERKTLMGAAFGLLTTIAMSAVKDYVFDHAKTYAKTWLGADEPTSAADLSSEKVGSDM